MVPAVKNLPRPSWNPSVNRFSDGFRLGLSALLFFSAGLLAADYPLIHYTVRSRDPLYSQQQQDVENWYRGDGEQPPLMVFRYRPTPSEDLFSVAAAFNLPYESLSTLNGWSAPGLFHPDREILVPNQPGIFIPSEPQGSWERDLSSARNTETGEVLMIQMPGGGSRGYYFIAGDRFSPEERISFLGSLFASPLAEGKITSPFGYRPHPFTGIRSFHPGVDMRAGIGTPVRAARDGIVFEKGTLEIYGHYIIINHEGGFQTVYAHLGDVLAETGQKVDAGDIIARSGNSGISTGPHLHFEIRRDGIPVDPSRLTSFTD